MHKINTSTTTSGARPHQPTGRERASLGKATSPFGPSPLEGALTQSPNLSGLHLPNSIQNSHRQSSEMAEGAPVMQSSSTGITFGLQSTQNSSMLAQQKSVAANSSACATATQVQAGARTVVPPLGSLPHNRALYKKS